MADKIYVGDIGTLFIVDTESDLSGATVNQVQIKKPDGTTHNWAATVDGTTLRYVTVDGDLDQSGNFLGQAYVELPSGKWHGERFTFRVFDEWE